MKLYAKELNSYSQLRNLNCHSYDLSPEYAFSPHPDIVRRMEMMAEEIAPQCKIFDVCIERKDIFTAKLSDSIGHMMKKVHDNTYTHIPVVDEEEKVIGAFTESTIFNYCLCNSATTVNHGETLKDIEVHLDIANRKNEFFDFAHKDELFVDVKTRFLRLFQKRQRLGAVFITENGHSAGRLLGMVTALDMLTEKTS